MVILPCVVMKRCSSEHGDLALCSDEEMQQRAW